MSLDSTKNIWYSDLEKTAVKTLALIIMHLLEERKKEEKETATSKLNKSFLKWQ